MSGTIGDNTGKQSGVIASGAGGIDIVDTDPTASEGTVFFNTSDNVLKVFNNVGAWSSGGSLSVDFDLAGGCGTQDAAMGSGPDDDTDGTQEYNGSAWSAGGNMNHARYWLSNFGTQTAATSCGGYAGGLSNETEEYNGTAWSNSGIGNLSTSRYNAASAGTQNSGLYFGGSDSV